MTSLIPPHGGKLKERLLPTDDAEALRIKARDYASWDLTERQLCDMEFILNGGFSPVEGFMGRAEYDAVLIGSPNHAGSATAGIKKNHKPARHDPVQGKRHRLFRYVHR